MDVKSLLSAAAEERLTESQLAAAAAASGSSIHEVCDGIAREAARAFLAGQLEWDLGDNAMNHLYGLAYGSSDFGLPEFATSVFLAFDEGEYIHAGDDPANDGAPRTRKLLLPLMAGV
jgi:hypothetical protein